MIGMRKKRRGSILSNSAFQQARVRIALDELLLEYDRLSNELNSMERQQKIISIMSEMRMEFNLDEMSLSEESISKEVLFLYERLSVLSKEVLSTPLEK